MTCEICNSKETVSTVKHLNLNLCWVCLRIKASVLRECVSDEDDSDEDDEGIKEVTGNHLIPSKKKSV